MYLLHQRNVSRGTKEDSSRGNMAIDSVWTGFGLLARASRFQRKAEKSSCSRVPRAALIMRIQVSLSSGQNGKFVTEQRATDELF